VEAVQKQVSELVTHTRYLHESILAYSEDLLGTLPDHLDNIMYTCTGSEANDLAMRIAKQFTGGTGVIVTAEAYHGITTETGAISPSLGGRESVTPWAQVVAAPDSYRGTAPFVDGVAQALANFARDGITPAALIVDTIYSADGILTPDPTDITAAGQLVRAAGGLLIADEVQSGFGRLGRMWGFEGSGLDPDIVTTGKPMGSGQPIASVIARHEIVDAFGAKMRYFSTFAGNPVGIAAAQATLDVLRDDELVENAHEVGKYLQAGLRSMQTRHRQIGDIRGAGLFVGIDLVADPETKKPIGDYAFDIVNAMRERRVLVSAVGAGRNVLKVRPPLPFTRSDSDRFLEVLDSSLTDLAPHEDRS
jgi:4-aminobutyrate aminotransferase-like enzyme